MTKLNFDGIGTVWQIDIYKELSKDEEDALLSQIINRIESFDKTYSRFRDDSLITQISKSGGTFEMPDDAKTMISVYHDLYMRTNGLFTPLVGDLLSDAGYDSKYSLTQKNKLRTPPKWEDTIDYQYPKMIVKKPVLLDFGAGGKGYLVDLVAKILEVNDIFDYCIDASGDILHKGAAPIRVGLEDPNNINQVIGVCMLGDGSICGSSGNRRSWGKFTHIVNPKTLTSPTDIIAVWVTSGTAFIADCIATCLFFVKAQTLDGYYNFEYIILYKDYSIEKSAKFLGETFK